MAIEDIDEEQTKAATLIRTYGEYWNPEYVNWANRRELLGRRERSLKLPDVNVWEERGVYVLYKDYIPVYVGKALKDSIGRRLQLHRESWRKGPRWDSFSWFGLQHLKRDGNPEKLRTRASVSTAELIATLEALLIVVIDPRLNARKEKLKGALHIYQSDTGKPKDTEQRLADIETLVKAIADKSKKLR